MRRLILPLILIMLSGCANLALNRERPLMPVPDAWTESNLAGHNVDAIGWMLLAGGTSFPTRPCRNSSPRP